MAYQAVPNVIQTNVRATLDTEQIENVFYWQANTVPTPELVGNVAADVLTAWTTSMLPVLQTNYTLREVYALDLSLAEGPTSTAVPISTSPGTLGGAPLPNNVAICLSHRTAARGRSFRGRTYLPGGSQSTTTGPNHFSASYATDVLAAFVAFQVAVQGDTAVQLCVVSRVHNKAPRAVGLATVVTSSLFVDLVLDSQRRRLPGRGQ